MSFLPARDASNTTTPSTPDVKRRRFLLALGAGSAGAAAAAVPIAQAVEATGAQDEAAKGYRETEHVRDYYATTRL